MGKKEHLPVPGVGIQRPAMREGYNRPSAPVLVVDFGAVLGRDCAHSPGSFAFLVDDGVWLSARGRLRSDRQSGGSGEDQSAHQDVTAGCANREKSIPAHRVHP